MSLFDILFSGIGASQANTQANRNITDYNNAETSAVNAFKPYAALGQTGATNLTNMSTPGFQFNPTDPSYAFRFNQGIQAGDRSAAAHGVLLSGGQQKALTDYGQGAASTEYGNEFARNLQLTGQGLTAAQGDANAFFAGANGRAGQRDQIAKTNQGFWGGVGGTFNSMAAGGFSPQSVLGFGGKSW
jgi:hypothetical protein